MTGPVVAAVVGGWRAASTGPIGAGRASGARVGRAAGQVVEGRLHSLGEHGAKGANVHGSGEVARVGGVGGGGGLLKALTNDGKLACSI